MYITVKGTTWSVKVGTIFTRVVFIYPHRKVMRISQDSCTFPVNLHMWFSDISRFFPSFSPFMLFSHFHIYCMCFWSLTLHFLLTYFHISTIVPIPPTFPPILFMRLFEFARAILGYNMLKCTLTWFSPLVITYYTYYHINQNTGYLCNTLFF